MHLINREGEGGSETHVCDSGGKSLNVGMQNGGKSPYVDMRQWGEVPNVVMLQW